MIEVKIFIGCLLLGEIIEIARGDFKDSMIRAGVIIHILWGFSILLRY